MGVRINTNIEALNAQRNLGMTATQFAKSVEKLSSGLRINRAADDAAGLAISEKLRAQVRGLNQAQRNAQDGISMVQTAEGALTEVHSMLQRMRELSVQASNSTLSTADAASVNTEMTALRDEIDRVAGATTFNGQNLLTGALSTSLNAATSGVKLGSPLATATGTSVTGVDVSGAKVGTTYTIAQGTLGAGYLQISDASGVLDDNVQVASGAAAPGTQTLRFAKAGIALAVSSTGNVAATAANIGADLVTLGTVITSAGSSSANFQIGANASDTLSVSFGDARTSNVVGYGTLATDITAFSNATVSGIGVVSTAQTLITSIDKALAFVSTTRGNFGAVQNRLEHTVNSLGVSAENLSASESRIRDLDVASEMVSFTKTQILQQAGTAILAQANQAPQNILSLLR